ncbi:hypothetical protein HHI36_012226, partial [Cryptolaemus montrouzieri]
GDFNSKSPDWGSRYQDIRGRMLAEMMATVVATAENVGKAPTFQRGTSESVIGITLANAKMSECLKGWRGMEEDSLSLHNYITFEIYSKKQPV